jgi:hypothetical protein
MALVDQGERSGGAGGRQYVVAAAAKGALRDAQDGGFVVDDELDRPGALFCSGRRAVVLSRRR